MRKQKRERIQLKGVLSDPQKILYMDYVKDVIPSRQQILLHPHDYYKSEIDQGAESAFLPYFFPVTIKDPKAFNKIKFEYIKWIKSDPNPDNRVAEYEWRDDQGLPDFDKLDRLIGARKTREEKKAEIDDDMQFIKDCEKIGLDCDFLKESLKEKIRRG